jgi:hypothetical protein
MGEILPSGNKEKGLLDTQRMFLKKKKPKSPYLEVKSVQVAIFNDWFLTFNHNIMRFLKF